MAPRSGLKEKREPKLLAGLPFSFVVAEKL
jgi:hypothetical protein